MEKTTNYQLNKPAASDYISPTPFNDNADIIDAELAKRPLNTSLTAHTGNANIHVTADQKTKWDGYETVHTLTHVRSSSTKVHILSVLGSVTGVVSCQFKATAAYTAGDTFRVNGATYAVKLQNGEDAEDNLFVSGALVSCIIDTAGKTINFRAGGAGQLKKYAAGSVTITKTADGKGSGTVSGLAFTPQVVVLSSDRIGREHQVYIREKSHKYWHDMRYGNNELKIDDAADPLTITKNGFQLTDISLDTYYTDNISVGGTSTVPYWCYG